MASNSIGQPPLVPQPTIAPNTAQPTALPPEKPPAVGAAGPASAEAQGSPDSEYARGIISECAPFFPERPEGSTMHWPPGLLGEVAKYIYCNSPSPVPEYAIATAIGFFAGICGRGWTVTNTGLNHDIVILGPSGSGKNVVETGIFNIVKQLDGVPIAKFIFKGHMASQQALVKRLTINPCFLQIIGEVGKLYRAYSKSRYGDPIDQLFTEKLRLWESSGPDGASSGILYSDSDKNVEGGVISGVAHSTLGDSTPNAFYGSLKSEMWEQGFISRLWIFEYAGSHPDGNRTRLEILPPQLLNYLRYIVQEAARRVLIQEPVTFSPEATEWMEKFTERCRDRVHDARGSEEHLQLAVRTREKVLRLAALCAVADNYHRPVIQVRDLDWAELLSMTTTDNIEGRLVDGTIDNDTDHTREAMILDRCRRWMHEPRRNVKEKALQDNAVITRRFLQQEVASKEIFKNHKFGAVQVFNNTMKSLVANGYLAELKKEHASSKYGVTGECWYILDLGKC